ncbi:MAG: error-prone DNA polymerase [Mitsuaria chitosanitabida]|uniref:error-prone DNA polymerase n=1 Tax=Roseateles chitosanitabidus TaxID=65048 RepID=UPI001B2E9519|nr:error-prone DNA polymerase [Roseateles chitosanitabidus]MBO9689567.1 error-prone DNA polymerase [Roseateles chitosanitabidus]
MAAHPAHPPDSGDRHRDRGRGRADEAASRPEIAPDAGASATLPDYAELRCLSNFSFLRGASWPEELVGRAKELGYAALAITDECSMAGVVRAHVAARKAGLKLLVGSQLRIDPRDGAAPDAEPPFTLIVLACNLNGYGNLCQLISRLRRSAEKGSYRCTLDDIGPRALDDCVVVACPDRLATAAPLLAMSRWLLSRFIGRCWLGVTQTREIDDEIRLLRLREVAALTEIPLVAVGDALMHVRSRKPLQDVLTATRLGKRLTECGQALDRNAERHLRSRGRLALAFPVELLAETLRVAACCDFSLDELRYHYPSEVVPEGETPASHLRRLTYEGAGRRWPEGIPPQALDQIERELALIEELRYEHYFLTVADIVHFARSQGILCQGRGSAANSIVCYSTGVTEIDPSRMRMLFERFISKERNEPPDIDIDFEHERREEVIQYLYGKYTRERAALAAVVISYRVKSALRDVGKALGFDLEVLDRLAGNHQWWDGQTIDAERLRESGLEADDLAVRQLVEITKELLGFPRHLSQHPGGFVLTQGPLTRMVPVENASMPDRTVIEWDKDDLDAVGLLKVDVLGLGMLTAIRKTLDLIVRNDRRPFGMADIPAEDEATYRMIQAAETIGVFQIESRAQRSMLPRLRPERFYDLVIEVAIVRPGPIQGGMVHPYLQRREMRRRGESIPYQKGLEQVLERTLGIPVFQEQVMQIAMIAAGFTGGEADDLRRSMAAWRRKGGVEKYYAKIVDGMTSRGYDLSFAQAIFEQIKGFSEYGFPESHAASFALLVYNSSWLKKHRPAEFLAGMLNSQPLGFYSASQLVQDARRNNVVVLPPDVMRSDWHCTLEREDGRVIRGARRGADTDLQAPRDADGIEIEDELDDPYLAQDEFDARAVDAETTAGAAALDGAPARRVAVRLGLRLVKGLQRDAAERICRERRRGGLFEDAEDLARRTGLNQQQMTALAAGNALTSLSGHRRQQMWDAAAQHAPPPLLARAPVQEDFLALPQAPEGEEIVFDYASLGLTLRRHPLALLRPALRERGLLSARELNEAPNGRAVRACGIVTVKQQPATAKGTIFISLEDETGDIQVIVHRDLWTKQRQVMLHARLMAVRGRWQRSGGVRNLVAGHLEDLTPMLGRLRTESRDFH